MDELAQEMLTKLPARIDLETTERMMGPEIVMPMCVSLLQEITYYNTLLNIIISGLKVISLPIFYPNPIPIFAVRGIILFIYFYSI